MSLIDIRDLSFSYEGSFDTVFENFSVQLDTSWKLGLIGRNGKGKTTLLQLLQGEYAYGGQIVSAVSFEYFPTMPQNTAQTTEQAVLEVYPDLEWWRFLREFSLLDLDESLLYRPFESLSGGEKTKVMLAALFARENAFLLIDEPTNHLDAEGRALVGDYLNSKEGYILVSHDRAFLDRCVDHILALNRADVELQKGNFSSWWQNKTQKDEAQRAQNEKLRAEAKRLSAAARRTANWSDKTEKTKKSQADSGYAGHKAAKMMKRSKAIQARRDEALAQTESLLQNIEETDELQLKPLKYHRDLLFSLQDVSVFYDGKKAVGPVRFSVSQGERVALRGKNGSGKSSLLKLIEGATLTHTGQAHLGSGLILSKVEQDSGFLSGDLSDFAQAQNLDKSLFFAILRKLGFARTQFEKDLRDYSAGQKKKVLLAKSLCEPAHIYLWDEPLNYIDLFSRMQIEQLVLQSGATMVFVEHDRAFSEKVATKIIQLPD